MSDLLTGRQFVVMGVSNKRSIAWGCAQSIQKLGGRVIYTYQNERLEKELKKITAEEDILVQCDVSDDNSVKSAFKTIMERCGKVDGIVHSIAFANKEELEGDFTNASREGFLLAHNISAYSLVAVAKGAYIAMNNGGSIVTMTYLGSERVIPNYNVMGAAKASLEASVRYLAVEMGKQDIRVNAISAGAIKTLAASGVKDFSKLLELSVEKIPSGKTVTIEEVGNTAVFLLSELSSGITGEVIYVDRGFHLQ